MMEDTLELIAEREAQILAEGRAEKAEKPAERRLHRVSAKARTKTTAKAPKQTAKTTAKAPKQTAKTTEVPKQEGNIVLETWYSFVCLDVPRNIVNKSCWLCCV